MKKFLIVMFGLSIGFLCKSQINPESKRASHWYFGNGAGIDFSSGNPICDLNGSLNTYEGSASISDLNGNLLFYSDGDTVWNKFHQPMPNGKGLKGCFSSAQSCLIVPKPKSSDLYYVFTVDCGENNGNFGLRYSVVNMSLDGGKGDVEVLNKNIMLHAPCTEGLAAIGVCDSLFWVTAHEFNTDRFRSYKINSTGVNSTPIISQIGSIYNDYVVYMRYSPNAEMIASCFTYGDEIYQFNSLTGVISNSISLSFSLTTGYCPIFSNNNSKLYISNNGDKILQYDVTNYSFSAVNSSKSVVADAALYSDNSSFWALSNALDSKIYVASYDKDSLSLISNPNLVGLSCSFVKSSISLNARKCQLGLPDFPQNYFNSSSFNCPPSGSEEFDNYSIPFTISYCNDEIKIKNNLNESFFLKILNVYGTDLVSTKILSLEEKRIEMPQSQSVYILQLTNQSHKLNYKFLKK